MTGYHPDELTPAHVAETGCGLALSDFDPDDPRPCIDGGLPHEHPDN